MKLKFGGRVALVATLTGFVAEMGAAEAPNPILTPVPAQSAPASAPLRSMSAEMTARLAVLAPKYSPPIRGPGTSPAAAPDDPPANGIVRLPRFLVEEKKERLPDEREILSAKGETAFAMQRYITEIDRALNFFTLPLFGEPKEARARRMLREDRRLEDMDRYQNLVELTRLTDPKGATKMQRTVNETFMREPVPPH